MEDNKEVEENTMLTTARSPAESGDGLRSQLAQELAQIINRLIENRIFQSKYAISVALGKSHSVINRALVGQGHPDNMRRLIKDCSKLETQPAAPLIKQRFLLPPTSSLPAEILAHAGAESPTGVPFVLTAESLREVQIETTEQFADQLTHAIRMARALLNVTCQEPREEVRQQVLVRVRNEVAELRLALDQFMTANPNDMFAIFTAQRLAWAQDLLIPPRRKKHGTKKRSRR